MRGDLRFASAAWGASLRQAMARRAAFLVAAGFMLLNNLLWLSFWAVFFARFESVGGWELRDLALVYAIAATGFGLAVVFGGGILDIAPGVAEGRLDTWLLRSRPVFLQAAVSRMRLPGFGDMATGVLLVVLSGNASPGRLLAFAVMSVVAAVVFASFWTLCHAAAFWLGRAEEMAQQGVNAIVTFSLYPSSLFGGWTRVLLHVVVPAGLVSWLPAELVMRWDWGRAALLAGGVSALLAVTALIWRAGLARYESGNLVHSGQD